MNPNLFFNYYDAFEESVRSGDFDAVGKLMTEDVVYEISGVPFACTLRGRDAVTAGMARSTRAFDQKLDGRWLGVCGMPRQAEDALFVELLAAYRRRDAPDVHFTVTEVFREQDGRICHIDDRYDPETMAVAERWLAEYGAGLDPSYV